MKTLKIKAEKRTELGKVATRELRKQDRVPCVLYGGEEIVHFHVFRNDLRHLLITPDVYFVNLEISGNKYHAILKEAQFHPVSDEVLHLDFLQIFDDKVVVFDVPVKLEGQSVGVKRGGVCQKDYRYLRLKALPSNLPQEVMIDVTDLDIGNAIRIKDINIDNVEVIGRDSVVIVSIVTARGAAEAAEVAAAAEADGKETAE
jgi:large subunit ribosomal protein L25